MEKKNFVNAENEELPFSFKKEEISSEKVKEHWQRIAAKIAEKDKRSEENKVKKIDQSDTEV